jgi:hypothetical protein
MWIYRYAYFKLYQFMLRTPNRNLAISGASTLLSCVDLLYLFAFFICIKPHKNLEWLSESQFFVLFFGPAFFIYVVNLWYFQKKHSFIVEEFEKETSLQSRIGGLLVALFSIGSITAVIILGILLKNQ